MFNSSIQLTSITDNLAFIEISDRYQHKSPVRHLMDRALKMFFVNFIQLKCQIISNPQAKMGDQNRSSVILLNHVQPVEN